MSHNKQPCPTTPSGKSPYVDPSVSMPDLPTPATSLTIPSTGDPPETVEDVPRVEDNQSLQELMQRQSEMFSAFMEQQLVFNQTLMSGLVRSVPKDSDGAGPTQEPSGTPTTLPTLIQPCAYSTPERPLQRCNISSNFPHIYRTSSNNNQTNTGLRSELDNN